MSAKKKGVKLKKSEMERLEKEEEERRWEEEEARSIAEREEQEKLEKEQKEEEERQRLELKDQERREDELNELCLLLERNQALVKAWESDSRENAKWDRYMLCDGSPNPAVQPEINTFISLWTEDPEVQIKPILQQCALALQLLEELDLLLSEETDSSVVEMYQETMLSLQNLIHAKYLQGTEEILKSAKACADFDTGDMQMLVNDDNVTLCLWANLSKNSGVKFHPLGKMELGFDLPRKLAMSDIGVRILHTHYDHLTHLSRKNQDHRKRPAGMTVDAGSRLAETPEVVEDGETSGEEEKSERSEQANRDLQQSAKSEGKKNATSVHSAKEEGHRSPLKKMKEGDGEIETVTEGQSIPENQTADEVDSTPAIAQTVNNSTDSHVVDLQQYIPLGGVFYFDAFHLPPQRYTFNSWEIKEISDTGLKVFPYPPEQSLLQNSFPPVDVTIGLPDSVIFLEDPLVARWNPAGKHWRTDGITDTSYNPETRSISFKMESFNAFTLLQEMYANMPFQSWELRPLGQDSALFTITAALAQFRITVKANQCMLQMDKAPELAHILGKWMGLSALQTAMSRAGVNIFVNEYSEKYVIINVKDPLIEHAVYEQMALMASAFAFSWSQWNAQCGQEHLVLQVCEHLVQGPVQDDAWSLYLLGAQRSQRLKITERSEGFSTELAEETEFHSTFLHMLRDGMSPDSHSRVENSHYLYTDTVQRLICATRVLTFS